MTERKEKLTAVERLKIYETLLAAYKESLKDGHTVAFSDYNDSPFICVHLQGALMSFRIKIPWDDHELATFFPEFFSQKPKSQKIDAAWWRVSINGIKHRIKALERSIDEVNKLIENGG